MNDPFFSIIIPSYNRAHLIYGAVKSVISQSFSQWELIIIDDGSTDNTKDVIREFSDNRIYYYYQDNAERSAARNNGIQRAKGAYICFLDSDDYYLENHLQVLHAAIALNNKPVAFFYTGAYTLRNGNLKPHKIYTNKNEHPVRFVFRDFLYMNSVCIHKDILAKFKFNESLSVWEDNNLWIRILLRYPFVQIEEFTTVCVDHEERGGNKMFKEADLKVLKNYERSINDLFLDTLVLHILKIEEKKELLSKKFLTVALVAAWNSKFSSMLKCLSKAIRIKPSVVISPVFFKIWKEFLANSIKKAS